MSMRSENEPEYEDYSCFVSGLVREIRPLRVLEVGLGPSGYSARGVLNALVENEKLYGVKGKYTFIELAEEQRTEPFKKVQAFEKRFWEARWGDSRNPNLFCDITDQSGGDGPVDIALIDGNHTTEYCYNDARNLISTNNIWAEKGLFVFHDVMMNTVRVAIEKLKEDFNLDVFYMPQRSIALARIVLR